MYLHKYKFHNLSDVLVKARVNDDFYRRRGGIKYFISEYKIQKVMLNNHIISLFRFILNVLIRFFLQVLISENIRGVIFKNLARKKV